MDVLHALDDLFNIRIRNGLLMFIGNMCEDMM